MSDGNGSIPHFAACLAESTGDGAAERGLPC